MLRERLQALEAALNERGRELALLLVYDRPSRTKERPGLARTYFAQRCVSDGQLNEMIEAFRSIGAYVELFGDERPFIEALADGRLERLRRDLIVVYNGIGWGVTRDGFQPGRKALIPALADTYGLIAANSDAYVSAFALHRYHSSVVLGALGVRTPPVWLYRPRLGWAGRPPPAGKKVIAKSTYEAWSVGVTDASVFVADESLDARVAAIADDLGQPITVQEFVSGREVCVPVLECPERLVLPPVETVLAKAPGDRDAVMTLEDNLARGAVAYPPYDGPREAVEVAALRVFDVLQLRGFGRIDFRLDADYRPWVTDVAISPGLSTAGSSFASLATLGFDHASFLRVVVAASLAALGRLAPPFDLGQPEAASELVP